MKNNILKGVAFFLCGLMLMQILFVGESKSAKADHSESATIVPLPCVMDMYMADTSVDASVPAPFNGKVPYGISAGAIKDSKKQTYEICYCIAYDKVANTSDSLSSKAQDAQALLTNDQAMLINTAILLGYNKQNFKTSGLTQADRDAYFATQVLVWIIKGGYFDKDTERTAVENFFFKKMPSIKTNYQTLYKKVKEQVSVPSFVTTTENVMKYNATNKKFELTLTNTTAGAMNTLKVDTTSLPEGVTATINGENLVLSSTKEFTTATKIKLTKAVNQKGGLVAWKNTSGDKQPQVSIDYDLDPVVQTLELPVKTDVAPKSVEDPKPTVQPTQAPKVDEGQKIEEPVYETKEVANNSAMDASPKTADSSNLNLAYKLVGASLFTMISLYVVSIINKRKQRF